MVLSQSAIIQDSNSGAAKPTNFSISAHSGILDITAKNFFLSAIGSRQSKSSNTKIKSHLPGSFFRVIGSSLLI